MTQLFMGIKYTMQLIVIRIPMDLLKSCCTWIEGNRDLLVKKGRLVSENTSLLFYKYFYNHNRYIFHHIMFVRKAPLG